MRLSEQFRQYAVECHRLAQRATPKDRAVLMEIAEAWLSCAEQAERKSVGSEMDARRQESGGQRAN